MLFRSHIAKYNFSTGVWSALGPGISTGTYDAVTSLAVWNNELYVGGIFSTAGGVSANNIAKYKAPNLPVDWKDFTVTSLDNKSVIAQWSTSSEANNEYFTVERSRDGKSFGSIFTVDSKGGASAEQKYSFTDAEPYSGSSYYRVKQTDRDGNYTYSNMAEVYVALPGGISAGEVTPEPVVNGYSLKVNSSGAENVQVEVMDVLGRIVLSRNYALKEGENIIEQDTRMLGSGVYSLSIQAGSKRIVKKFMKE